MKKLIEKAEKFTFEHFFRIVLILAVFETLILGSMFYGRPHDPMSFLAAFISLSFILAVPPSALFCSYVHKNDPALK